MANSKRKCKHCLEYIKATSGIKVPAGFFCGIDHATEFAQAKRDADREKQKAKVKREVVKKEKTARSDLREFRNNDKSHQTKLTQASFNAWIRFRDEGEPCNSCGRSTGCKINAGHYLSVGSHPELRFNPLNVNLQCEYCNVYKSGNIKEYRPRLIDKIGLELVEWLEGPNDAMKYTCEQLREIRAYYAKLTRQGVKDDSDRPHNKSPN